MSSQGYQKENFRMVPMKDLLISADLGIMTQLYTTGISRCVDKGIAAAKASDIFDPQDALWELANMKDFFFISPRFASLPTGVYANVSMEDPSESDDRDTVTAYPLLLPYAEIGHTHQYIWACMAFPDHAVFNGVRWNQDKEQFEHITQQLIKGKEAAQLFRIYFFQTNNIHLLAHSFVDITNPDILEEVAKIRETTVEQLFIDCANKCLFIPNLKSQFVQFDQKRVQFYPFDPFSEV